MLIDSRPPRSRRSSEAGVAMVVALIVAMLVIALGSAYMYETVFRTKAADNARELDEGMMIAESGLERTRRAVVEYIGTDTSVWADILTVSREKEESLGISDFDNPPDPDTIVAENSDFFDSSTYTYYRNYAMDGSGASTPVDDTADLAAGTSYLGSFVPYAEGGYHVLIRDDDDGDGNLLSDSNGEVIAYVTTMMPDGAIRQIEARLRYDPDETFIPDSAVLVDGNLVMNGTPDIMGDNGSAYANGDITFKGTPSISVSADATGEITGEDGLDVPSEGFNEGVAEVELPDIVPSDLKAQAEADGYTVITLTPGNAATYGFTYSAVNDEYSSTSPASGNVYYTTGHVKLSGSTTFSTTIFAEKSISITGKNVMTPKVPNLLFAAGGDIKLKGTSGCTVTGFMGAQEQISMSGTFDLTGVAMAKDASDDFDLVSSSSSLDEGVDLGGTCNITYNGGMDTGILLPVDTAEIRHVRKVR